MKKRVTTGLTILGGAGLLFAFGDLLIPQENVLFEAALRPQEFAELVTSAPYKLWSGRGFIGVLMEMIGTIALYLWLSKTKVERIAFWGLLFTLTHHILGLGVFTVTYFVFPMIGHEILQGNTEIVRYAAISGDLGILMATSLLSTLIGLAIMAVAVFKSGVLPKWSGWMAFIGFLLIPVPGVAIQFLTNLLWAAAYFWMAYHVHKQGMEENVKESEMALS